MYGDGNMAVNDGGRQCLKKNVVETIQLMYDEYESVDRSVAVLPVVRSGRS